MLTPAQARELAAEQPFAELLAELAEQREATSRRVELVQAIEAELMRRFPTLDAQERQTREATLRSMLQMLLLNRQEQERKTGFLHWLGAAGMTVVTGVKNVVTYPFRRPLVGVLLAGALGAFLLARYWGAMADAVPVPNIAPLAEATANKAIPPVADITVPDTNSIQGATRPSTQFDTGAK
jgi:hypothetical protein